MATQNQNAFSRQIRKRQYLYISAICALLTYTPIPVFADNTVVPSTSDAIRFDLVDYAPVRQNHDETDHQIIEILGQSQSESEIKL